MRKTLEEFFSEVETKTRREVKDYIIRNNVFPYICSNCGCDGHWRDGIISLELHHINGINNDHRLENLTFLCPNCHALTENYGYKNVQTHPKLLKYCPNCGKVISRCSKQCLECAHEKQKRFDPSREELKEKIRKFSWRELGRQYEVSDTAIKKRCKAFGLPFTTKEIKSYSDEEWDLI